MNNRNNKDFDELEPRVTPQPTILPCMTGPSVPEVSLIFGKNLTTSLPEKNREASSLDYDTYANWKKDGPISLAKPRLDSRCLDEIPANRSANRNNDSLQNSISSNTSKFNETINANRSNKQRLEIDRSSDKKKQNSSTEINNYRSPTVARKSNVIENRCFQNYTYPRGEVRAISYSRNKSMETGVVNTSNETVKSILKNSSPDTNEFVHMKNDFNPEFIQRTNIIENTDFSRQSFAPRCNHRNSSDEDRETVRQLLMLVQNQNEQIKSLQSQVERLLQAHEQNYVGINDNSGARKCDTLPGNTTSKIVTTQTACQSRGMNISAPNSPGDKLRNAIVEKKVSIGVMTSFEFSVHNNPFVNDADPQINAVLRECGKNINENGDNWRNNVHCPRNIVPGTLENINEDSESHPSSIWKQSNNNTHLSSSVTTAGNENRSRARDAYSSISEAPEIRTNFESSTALFDKSCPPVAAPRRFSSINDKKRIPESSRDRRTVSSRLSNERERELFRGEYRGDDGKNVENAVRTESTKYPNAERKDCRNSNNSTERTNTDEHIDDNSIVLSTSDVRITERYPPSPDPSIHVEMREYSSDDENDKSINHAPPVGWTFYKNVVGQVNRILHTIPDEKDLEAKEITSPIRYQREHDGREEILDSVKLATLERLKMMGISFAEHSELNGEHVQKKVTFDSSYYPRVDYQTTVPQSTSAIGETNTSMHMKALALKYLSDEQLADLAIQRQGNNSAMKHKVLNSMHATNMSLATMNYLQRYCLVSGINATPTEVKGHIGALRQKKLKHVVMTKEFVAQATTRQNALENSVNNGAPGNILDITTLKQQPKLL